MQYYLHILEQITLSVIDFNSRNDFLRFLFVHNIFRSGKTVSVFSLSFRVINEEESYGEFSPASRIQPFPLIQNLRYNVSW